MTTNQQPVKGKAPQGAQPAAAQPTPAKGKKQKKPRKPVPRVLLVVDTVLIMLFLLAGSGAALYFNLFNITPMAIGFLQSLNPQYQQDFTQLKLQQENLTQREDALKEQQKAVDNTTEANTKKEAELTKKQDDLNAQIAAFDAARQAAANEAASPKADQVAEIYTNLDAKAAAAMLEKAGTTQEIADILAKLDPAVASEILANMDPKVAYDVTSLLPN